MAGYPLSTTSDRGDHIRSHPDRRGRKIRPGASRFAGFTGFSPRIEVFPLACDDRPGIGTIKAVITVQPLFHGRHVPTPAHSLDRRREGRMQLPLCHEGAADLVGQTKRPRNFKLGEEGCRHLGTRGLAYCSRSGGVTAWPVAIVVAVLSGSFFSSWNKPYRNQHGG